MKKRLTELIYKLISVKGLVAIIATVLYFINPIETTFYIFVGSWGLLIGLREVYKVTALIKGVKDK